MLWNLYFIWREGRITEQKVGKHTACGTVSAYLSKCRSRSAGSSGSPVLHKPYVIIINALATSVIIIRRDCWYYLLFRDAVEISSICKNFKTASSSETPVTPIPLKVLHEPLPQEKILFESATNDDRLELWNFMHWEVPLLHTSKSLSTVEWFER